MASYEPSIDIKRRPTVFLVLFFYFQAALVPLVVISLQELSDSNFERTTEVTTLLLIKEQRV